MRARIAVVAAAAAVMVGVAVPSAVAGEERAPKKDKQCVALIVGGHQSDGVCVPVP